MGFKLLLQILIVIILFNCTETSDAQVRLRVRVNSGSANCSNCCDQGVFGGCNGSDPLWRVNVAGQGWTTYPVAGLCFTNPPNDQYDETFNCAPSYPGSIQVCFRTFDDDGTLCVVSEDCAQTSCLSYPVPAPGGSNTYTISIPQNGACGGNLNFTIYATGSWPGNGNDICTNAINLGTLNSGTSLGNSALSNYNNFCATGDANPSNWNADQGVWFQFTTGPNPSSQIEFDLNNDPQSLGDQIDLQVAIYEGSCGALTEIQSEHDGLGVIYDEDMYVNCLNPNTTYYLLVDGHEQLVPWGGGEGFFGIQINDNGIVQAGDEICDAMNLGTVPAGGSIGTAPLSQSNICATNLNDPTPPAWGSDNTVWYLFQAPPSGHVFIDANADLPYPIGQDAIDLQLAVYGSNNGTCSGTIQHIASDYTPGSFDEDFDVRCLTPGENYWIMVDGSILNTTGIFDITLSDGGDYPAPNDLICDAIPLGSPGNGGTVSRIRDYNYCANNLFEPIPNNWGNDMGVWYTFIAPPSGKVEISLDWYFEDIIDLQVAVYDLSGATCTGTPTEIASEHDGIGVVYGEDMTVDCLIPGREYWILVDGEGSLIDPDLVEGYFDIDVYGVPQDPAGTNDDPCNAIALGDPTGGSVGTTPGPLHPSQNNFCADAIGEPQPSNFNANQTVWYTFVAPSTGAVNFSLVSDALVGGTDAINLEIAVYNSPSCSGPWIEEVSGSDLTYDVDLDVWCLVPGQTYYVQIDGEEPELLEGHEGYFDITISEIPPIPVSPNDTICGAIALGDPWTNGTISLGGQHNLCADDWGDPDPTAFDTDRTVWYTFTTPATGGPFAIDIQATSDLPWPFGTDAIDLQLAVYESSNNSCTGTLNEMASEYDFTDLFNEFMNVRCLEEGRTYFLMVDGSWINVQGYFDLSISAATPVPIPSNDLICDHIDLGTIPIGGSIVNGVDYSNFCSDIEPGEPNPFAIEQTVWFSFIAPNHGGINATSNVTINAISDPAPLGDEVDIQLAVYSSSNNLCSGSMTLVEDGSSDPVGFDASVSTTCLYPGQRYFVQVDGSLFNQEGYFRLELIDDGAGVRPPYNMICNAVNLGTVPNGGTINNGIDYTNLCSDTEIGEPNPSAFGIGSTVWFTFIAPASGNVTIDALSDPNNIGDDVDLQLALYSSSDNSCTGSFLEIDSDYDAISKDETLVADCLEAGRIYYLQVDGAGTIIGDEDGWFTLQITDDGGTTNYPYNNDICNAYDFGIPGASIQTLNNEINVCANVEVGEPGVANYATHTVWYQFTAPASGRVQINVSSTNMIIGLDPEVYIYASSDNSCTGVLSLNSSSSWPTALITESIDASCLIPGNTYFIQVDGQLLETEGSFNIDIVDLIPSYIPPSNNACDAAIALTVQPESCQNGSGVFTQLNYQTPTITYNPAFAQGCGGNCGDTWYQFTMPFTGNAVIEGNDDGVGGGIGDFSDLTVVAYTGSCGNLTPIECDQGGISDDVAINIAGTPGQTIWVQVFDDNGNDVGENYEICVSIGCGFDNCLDAVIVPILPNVPYCFNTSAAEPEDVASGAPGYFECSEGDNPEHSIYYYFETDCNGSDVTLHVIDGQINGSCILGITPTDGFNISLFQDATPCDNNPDALVDCQSFTACEAQPINWNFTYTGLTPNTPYMIQIDGGFGSFGGNNTGEIMITTTTSALLTPNSTDVSCSGADDGTASATTAGGSWPFTYQWSNGGTDSTIIGLSPGTYNVTVTGNNGCVEIDSVNINDGAIITAAALPPTTASCFGACDGMATVIGIGGDISSGGYTYVWDASANNQTTANATGLCAGSYAVSVYDDNLCFDSTTVTIIQPAQLFISLSNPTESDCDSSICTGSVVSNTIGGSGSYTYIWSNGSTVANPTDLCPGLNEVTVSDGNCTDSTSIIINSPLASSPPIINPLAGVFCPNETVTLTASGGTAGTASSIYWYSGPNGTGSLLGTGNSISYTTSSTDTIYVRREGTCGPTVDSSMVIQVKYYIYAADGTSTNTYCTDDNGWHHFYVGDEIIFSVQGDISAAPPGFPLVTIWDSTAYYQETEGPATAPDCSIGLNPGEERFEMERSWNVNMGGGALAPPYNIRFYYEPNERTDIENAAINWMATYPDCGYSYKYAYPLGFYWFKNIGENYDAPMYDSLHIYGPDGTTNNGVNYAEIQNINSFSGGSGAIILIPITLLPVNWLYFDGETLENNTNLLSWATAAEDNTDQFIIERSDDGIHFESIGGVKALGITNNTHEYEFLDINPMIGDNYYRIVLVDQDGSQSISNTLLLDIDDPGIDFNFYPNPTDGNLYYQFIASEKDKLEIKLMDALGKMISLTEVETQLGMNNIPTDLNTLPAGTYMIRVQHKGKGYVHIAKIIRNN